MHAIGKALAQLPPGPFVLAISGGRDSMALLRAFVEYRRGDVAVVATFDHGTGPAATAACGMVREVGEGWQLPVAVGRVEGGSRMSERSEAAWRDARWIWLRMIAGLFDDIPVVTAHTREDQAETVAMRILRGASARGLAGMAYPTPGIVRPFLGISRSLIAEWAAEHDVPYIEDPTNASPRFLRNRLRGDLLPAAARAHPGFVDALVSIGARAAAWRSQVATLVDELGVQVGAAVVVPADALRGMDRAALAIVWPELAGRAGVAMDHRGVARAAAWTPTARAGQRIPLSGGIEIVRTRTAFAVRRAAG